MTARLEFTCDCFHLRHENPEGEAFWQHMMSTRKEICEYELLKACDPALFLDTDETWEEWKDSQADSILYYEADNAYLIQLAGFEYIFKKEIRTITPCSNCNNKGYVGSEYCECPVGEELRETMRTPHPWR